MNLLHINSYWSMGGAETILRESIRILRRWYPETEHALAASISGEPVTVPESRLCRLTAVEGVTPASLGGYFFHRGNYRRLRSFLFRIRPDIVHLHNFLSLSPSVIAAIREARELLGFRDVQSVQDFSRVCPNTVAFDYKKGGPCLKCVGRRIRWSGAVTACDPRGRAHSILKFLRSGLRDSWQGIRGVVDHHLPVSAFLGDVLRQDGIPAGDITVLRNFVNLPASAGRPETERENTILFHGRLSREKNLPFLVRGFAEVRKRVPDARLLLIGDGPDRDNIVRTIRETGTSASVDMLPHMTHEELYPHLSRSRVHAMPSIWYEGFPLAILEAIWHGLSVVVPAHGGLLEAVEFAGAGEAYPPEDLPAFVDAVTRGLKRSPAELDRIRKARSTIQRELSEREYARRLTQVYRSLVPARPVPSS